MYPILIVDDETLAKVTLQNIIQSHPQFNLAGSASNGAEALEFCAEHSVAAVITDLQMPVMGGVEFIKRLRETGFNGPILALSNYSDFELVRGAMKEGAFDYLLKADMKDNIMYEYLDRIYELIADDEEKRRTTYEKEQKDDKRNADLTEIAFRQYLQNAGSVIDEDLLLQSLPKGIFNCILVRATMKSDHLGPLVSYDFMCSMLRQVLEDVTLGHTIKINDHELVALIGRDDIEKQNIDFQLRLTRFYRSVKAYSMQAPVICYARSVENLSGLREAYKYCCQLEYTEITEDKPFTCIPDLNKATDSPVQGSVKTEVLQILHYIDEHIDDKLSLEDLSELVHLNREYLCRLFKKETGKSLFGYIAELRMQKAAKMIMDGHTSVQDVAQSIGFQNPYVFSKRFKEYYGVSPLKYDGRPPVSEAVRDEETE